MTTQVIFKIDKKLKEQAMKKAKSKGLAFSYFLKLATQAFVEDEYNVALIKKEEFNAKTRRQILSAIKDIKSGKNLSPSFKTAEEIKKYLEK